MDSEILLTCVCTDIWMLVFEVIKCAAKLKTLTVKNIFLSQYCNKRMYKDKKPKQTFNCESIYQSFFRISFILSQSRKRKCKKKWTTYTRHTSLEIIPNQVMPLINHDGRFRRRRIMFFNHIELKHVRKKWNCRKFFSYLNYHRGKLINENDLFFMQF